MISFTGGSVEDFLCGAARFCLMSSDESHQNIRFPFRDQPMVTTTS